MSRLLRANLLRLIRNRAFWGSLLALAAYQILCHVSTYRGMIKYDVEVPLDEIVLNYVIMAGIAQAVFTSLFLGTEYSDGTVRNKIIVGNSRFNVYMAGFITCVMAGILMFLATFLVSYLMGLPLFGNLQMKPGYFLALAVGGMFLCVSYAAMFSLAGSLISSKAHAAVVCILVSFALLFAASYLSNMLSQPEMIEQVRMAADGNMVREIVKNASYVEGMKRQIYQFLLDWIPSGQSIQISSMEAAHHWRMLVFSAVNSGLFCVLGYIFFKRKDMK